MFVSLFVIFFATAAKKSPNKS